MCNTITISSASPLFFFSLSYSVINSYMGLLMLIMPVDRRGQESNRWPSGWRTTAQPASPVYTHISPTHHPCFAGSVICVCVCVRVLCYYPQFILLLSGSMLSASVSYSSFLIILSWTLNPTENLMAHRKKKGASHMPLCLHNLDNIHVEIYSVFSAASTN